MRYVTRQHSAKRTDSYVFQQLIPYIGNKRKLLPLIGSAIEYTCSSPRQASFVDLFAGSGVVSRYAKYLGFRVISNDWEPYAEALNRCFIEANVAPSFASGITYEEAVAELNSLAPLEGWITSHLCPSNDLDVDPARDRMFYMRKNGMRIDAIRTHLAKMEAEGSLTPLQRDSLLAPLIYQACYTSNTSGVFKGFHRGWGGQTGTALYRIAGDLRLKPAIFLDNSRENLVFRDDATIVARTLKLSNDDIVYIDPPYNQHPYGSNYHVLNTVTLWDSPLLSKQISGERDKSAIRTDWRTARRSAYNSKQRAFAEYALLLSAISAGWILTSYSTDGNIDLASLVAANLNRGHTDVVLQGYKRYRVSSTRPSAKPMNIEFVLVTDTSKKARVTTDEIVQRINQAEKRVLSSHPESYSNTAEQVALF